VNNEHILLAVDGPSRAVFVLAWNADGRITTFGASADPRGQASGDLATRMSSQTSPNPPPDGLYWGSWTTVSADAEATTNTGDMVWTQPNSSLRAAIEGERNRARPIPTNGARTLIVVFPKPPSIHSSQWDLEEGKNTPTSLQNPLSYLTQGPTPTPYAALLGRPNGWNATKKPGQWAFYKDAKGRGWAFTILDF
jgi:hypothetical protein